MHDISVMSMIHTHTRLTALCPGLPGWASTRKVKPIWILLEQETVSGSGIIWAICKSASRSRQITTPAPHYSSFFTGRMPFLPPNQQCQSTEGTMIQLHIICIIHTLDFAVRQSGFLRRQFVNECCQFLLAVSQYFTSVFLKTLLIEGTLKTWGHRVGRGLVGLWLNPVLTVSSMWQF